MFSGFGIIVGFVVLGILVIAVVIFIVRSAISEVEKRDERLSAAGNEKPADEAGPSGE